MQTIFRVKHLSEHTLDLQPVLCTSRRHVPADSDDISSTPSFVINGRKYQNMSYGDFSAIIDEQATTISHLEQYIRGEV